MGGACPTSLHEKHNHGRRSQRLDGHRDRPSWYWIPDGPTLEGFTGPSPARSNTECGADDRGRAPAAPARGNRQPPPEERALRVSRPPWHSFTPRTTLHFPGPPQPVHAARKVLVRSSTCSTTAVRSCPPRLRPASLRVNGHGLQPSDRRPSRRGGSSNVEPSHPRRDRSALLMVYNPRHGAEFQGQLCGWRNCAGLRPRGGGMAQLPASWRGHVAYTSRSTPGIVQMDRWPAAVKEGSAGRRSSLLDGTWSDGPLSYCRTGSALSPSTPAAVRAMRTVRARNRECPAVAGAGAPSQEEIAPVFIFCEVRGPRATAAATSTGDPEPISKVAVGCSEAHTEPPIFFWKKPVLSSQ